MACCTHISHTAGRCGHDQMAPRTSSPRRALADSQLDAPFEELWGPDVLEFNPDREFRGNELWGDEPFAAFNPQSKRYSPFTYTPRDCMGKNFAQMEIRVILAHLFHEFEFCLSGSSKTFDRKSFLGVNRATLGPQDLGISKEAA